MSDCNNDLHTNCERFEDWLLESGAEGDIPPWQAHLETCSGCRRQWATHQMLVATFAKEAVPELSPGFQAGLDRKLEAAIRVEPLKGWRLAAMAGYGALAVLLMSWIFARFPPPSISIDTSSPWTMALAILAVPLSLWLTAAATRLLPSQRPEGARLLAL